MANQDPALGCVLPPDQTDFLAGQYFDIRLEILAFQCIPVSHLTSSNRSMPQSMAPRPTAAYRIQISPSAVRVTSKAYRRVALYEPGEYVATLTYYNRTETVANWVVRPLQQQKKAKDVILFIGDGMTTNMITAAGLITHKSINGKYQTKMQMDQSPVIGHQMVCSILPSPNFQANLLRRLILSTATSPIPQIAPLPYTWATSTANAMGVLHVYADSSADPFGDPKVETIVELLTRIWGSAIGVVSTAFIADATPIALTVHTRL
jgi:alkaline phosphatase